MTQARSFPASQRAIGAVPAAPANSRLRPLGSDQVRIVSGFWAERQRVNAERTLAHIEYWLRREGWTGNFRLAAEGGLPVGRRGREFSDSEVYKYLEALAWEIGRGGDERLESRFCSLVALVAHAQEPDGYLNTSFGRPGQPPRWSDLEWGHELYCLGHLFQAAVARARTRPDAADGLLAMACRAADLVCEVFGASGRNGVCGHPEVEMGLAELSRVTGEPRYLRQATLFVERRGTGTLRQIHLGQQYFQDEMPVRDATVLRGHAVRANYLSAGALDVAVETGDAALLEALTTQWRNTIARRTYLTGGQGSHHQDEGFGDDFELPADRAYSETCAGIASIMFSWRLLLAQADPAYADVIERTLYNVVATSPSRDGSAFYYANTLHQRQQAVPVDSETVSRRASNALRAPWFEVSCCPPNVARTFASLDALVATVDDEGLQLQQYAGCTIRSRLDDGTPMALDIDTDYPRSGDIKVNIVQNSDQPWTLSLRVPAWAIDAELELVTMDGLREVSKHRAGWATLRRAFHAGDVVVLHIPLPIRVTHPDPRIDAVRGCVALERGPLVYCLESVDLQAASGGTVADVEAVNVDLSTPPTMARGRPVVRVVPTLTQNAAWPYGSRAAPAGTESFEVSLVPYHDWAERAPSTMRVWMPLAQPTTTAGEHDQD